jgi:transketolase
MTVEISDDLRRKCRDTIRFLSADAVQQANSGHPGTPMGAADIAFVIWTEFMRHDPSAPRWANRDRFVLSGGHASMLLYSLLHLSGYDLPLEELKNFRQWGSRTPGHPEFGMTEGVEVTTGPLGAGFATAVGMALAGKMLAARFNTADTALIDAHIVGICGDGDMQEGVSSEAASLAGHLGLGNLIFVYDSNDITIEGHLELSIGEDTQRRFEAYGWFVQQCDGHDQRAIRAALERAKEETTRPSLIIAHTTIGAGAPNKAGTHDVHGSPLGDAEIKLAREAVGWPEERFHVPQEVRDHFAQVAARNGAARQQWEERAAAWRAANPDAAALWDAHWSQSYPADLRDQLVACVAGKSDATRNISGALIQKACALMPALIGGSADLEPSTKTGVKGGGSVKKASVESDALPDASFGGRNLHFGIREHAMGSVANGMALFGGWRPYNATFLVFSDYMRPPIRLAALSHLPTIFIYTHDSFWVGEDGPTHQPIEHVWSLRLIPNVHVWRPGDARETAVAWFSAATSQKTPSVLCLTRQKLPSIDRQPGFNDDEIMRGGYILAEATGGDPAVIIVATGSELSTALGARAALEADKVPTRVVSMPCVELFDAQPASYRDRVLPRDKRRVAVEAGRTTPWHKYIGDGLAIGLDHFGASAPGEVLVQKFGLDTEGVTQQIRAWLAR